MMCGTEREIPDMVTGKPDGFKTNAGKGLVSRLWGPAGPWLQAPQRFCRRMTGVERIKHDLPGNFQGSSLSLKITHTEQREWEEKGPIS